MVNVTTMTVTMYVTSGSQIATLTATNAAVCNPRVTPVETGLMHVVTMCALVWAKPLTGARVAPPPHIPSGNSTHVSSRSKKKLPKMVMSCKKGT